MTCFNFCLKPPGDPITTGSRSPQDLSDRVKGCFFLLSGWGVFRRGVQGPIPFVTMTFRSLSQESGSMFGPSKNLHKNQQNTTTQPNPKSISPRFLPAKKGQSQQKKRSSKVTCCLFMPKSTTAETLGKVSDDSATLEAKTKWHTSSAGVWKTAIWSWRKERLQRAEKNTERWLTCILDTIPWLFAYLPTWMVDFYGFVYGLGILWDSSKLRFFSIFRISGNELKHIPPKREILENHRHRTVPCFFPGGYFCGCFQNRGL